MSNCCNETLTLDSVDVGKGENIVIPYVAIGSGQIYELRLTYLRGTVSILCTSVSGQKLTFASSKLNPFFGYVGKIYNAQQNEVVTTVGTHSYNCYSFRTIRKM